LFLTFNTFDIFKSLLSTLGSECIPFSICSS
jgi:hypothetical protein